MECRSEKGGKVDAAIADDGSREGDNKADGEHAGEGEEQAGGGEAAAFGIGSHKPPYQSKKDDYPDEDQFDGEGKIDRLTAGPREGLEEAVERSVGESTPDARHAVVDDRKGEAGMTFQLLERRLFGCDGVE